VKFNYEYRTSDNVKHTGVVVASDRDAAYAALKTQGIKPGRLVEAPGFFNKLFGKGKRWIAIAALCVICLALCAFAVRSMNEVQDTRQQVQNALNLFDDTERRQLIGDAGEIEKGMKTGWRDVFSRDGDRFLAGFAVPGVPVAVRNVDESLLREALGTREQIAPTDPIEVRQIKSMVEGMKTEIRALLADGWTLKEVGASLVKRQDREIAYYNQAKREIETASKTLDSDQLLKLWEERNAQLRQMGIRLVQLPE